ncbi:PHT4 [Symbiodinium necroappetens]|uniref:PHT4 protein n=1 Tax=Symbiodinium necroappetens TaxID=1628268 RepID=A0A812ZH69_9DINO|nr:PHT4 [Symbiodinium necroappetens]
MERAMASACIQMCDPDPGVARDACKALLTLTPPLLSSPSQFDQVLAPVLARLSERPSRCSGLLEDTLKLLLILLESENGDLLERKQRVFPLVCERLLALLEDLLREDSVRTAQTEEMVLQILKASRVLIAGWYVSSGNSELPHVQLGYLAHLAIQLLSRGISSKGRPSRDQVISSVLVLQAMAEADAAADVLANFYPGVCTALVKLLLQAGKEFKVGFKIVILACRCLGEWTCAVLGTSPTSELVAAAHKQTPLTLTELFRQHNKPDGEAHIASVREIKLPPRTRSKTVLPQLNRNSAWLEETSLQTSEALVTVLRQAEVAAETLWSEKPTVRLAFLDLCTAILKNCRRSVTGEAVEACFEVVLAGLSDESQAAREAAAAFMLEVLASGFGEEPSVQVRGRIVEWLVKLARDLSSASSKSEGARHMPKRLARLAGLLTFIEDAMKRGMGQIAWQAVPAAIVPQILEPAFQASSLEASSLQNLLRDERPLTSVPGSAVSNAEHLVKLFPYDLGDMSMAGQTSARLDAGELMGPSTQQEVHTWLLRAMKLAGGDVSLARKIKTVLGRLGRAAGIEGIMALIAEDAECGWHVEVQTLEDPFPLFPSHAITESQLASTKDTSKRRRIAAMFALAAFLDACEAGACAQPPAWLAIQSLCIGLTGRRLALSGDCPESRLQVLCAHALMVSAMRSLALSGQPVHRQVKRLLKPLLEDLANASMVISTASHGTLTTLHGLLVEEGALQASDCKVGALLASYADYLAGDVSFQLRFGTCGQQSLPLLLTAVVQHASLEMTPFLIDVVHALLTMVSASEKSLWVLRILACAVQRLALIICEKRLETAGSRFRSEDISQPKQVATAVSSFFSGALLPWKPPRRRDGFFLHDLGQLLDDDAEENAEENEATAREVPSQACRKAKGRYDRERRVAASIVLWARHFLQSPDAVPRHLAHVAVIHGLTVLSTRVRDLLPHVHSVWQHMTSSFSDGVAMAALADSCVLLKHMARLSGDFIKRRFLSECWPGIWRSLKTTECAKTSQEWSSTMKMQWAALDALVFLAGDSSLVRGISLQLIALAIKFANPSAANSLRSLAWSLFQQMAKVDPDLLWMYVQALEPSRCGHCLDWHGSLLLEEVAGEDLLPEDRVRLKDMVDCEDCQPCCPRVALGVGGGLWCFYISKKELAFLEANVPKQEKKSSQGQLRDQDGPGLLGMPVAVALHHSLWAVFFAHIAFNYGAYYLTNWSPTYYSEVLKLTPEQAKYHLMLPHVANLICKSVNPLLVRLVERRGISLLSMRRLFTASGFLLAALCLLPVYRLRGHNPWVTTALCSAANAFFGLAPCGFKANYLDITEKYVGVISGYGNTLGTVASWVGPQFVAFLLHNFRSWDVVLFSVALMNIAAAMNYVRSSTVMPLERTLQTPEKAAEPKTE